MAFDAGHMTVIDDDMLDLARDDGSKRKYRAPALEKGLDILELLARSNAPMTATQMAAALGRSVSELFRIVQTLEYKRYVELSGAGDGYLLTNRLFALSRAQISTKTLHDVALPVMHRLAKTSTQACHLAVSSGDQMVVVARIDAPSVLGFSVRVGYRRPIIDAASGVVLFAFQAPAWRENWLSRLSSNIPRERIDSFLARAEKARREGHATAPNDFVQGIVDMSAPILEKDRIVAALSIPYVHRLPPRYSVEETIELVREAAAEISREIHQD